MTGPDPARGGPGRALFRFVRHWSRRATSGDTAAGEHGRDVWVAEAVHALAEDGRSEVTVNDVAAELGIDQSGASRMLTDAASRGYLDIAPSLVDGRRRATALTPVGRELLERAHAWQEQVFARLTQDWTERERAEFHRGMLRLIAASHDDAAG